MLKNTLIILFFACSSSIFAQSSQDTVYTIVDMLAEPEGGQFLFINYNNL
jgi:hypothetical protein